jgi:hypothetical protein
LALVVVVAARWVDYALFPDHFPARPDIHFPSGAEGGPEMPPPGPRHGAQGQEDSDSDGPGGRGVGGAPGAGSHLFVLDL